MKLHTKNKKIYKINIITGLIILNINSPNPKNKTFSIFNNAGFKYAITKKSKLRVINEYSRKLK